MTTAASPAIEDLIEEIADNEAADPTFYRAPEPEEAFVTDAKHHAEHTPGPAESARRAHGPKPPANVPWAHQPGCTNPVSDDWDCACGPEVIKA